MALQSWPLCDAGPAEVYVLGQEGDADSRVPAAALLHLFPAQDGTCTQEGEKYLSDKTL